MTGSQPRYSQTPERLKAYTDAVVAIAQTLLILPLLESVPEAKTHHLNTSQWLDANGDAAIWMVMSFVLIGSFWLIHQRVFEHVEHPSERLVVLNFAWMLSIVALPVIAAVLDLEPADNVQKLLYGGCLLAGSLAMNGMAMLVNRDSRLRGDLAQLEARHIAASLSQTFLYVVALLAALAIPGGTGYLAFGLMGLMPFMVRLLTPAIRRLELGA